MCPNALGLCSVSEVKGSKDMGIDIAALDTAGRDELLEHWRSLIGRPPPKHISRSLLIQIIAFELQSKQHRGFSKRLSQRLKRAALRDVMRPAFKPGSSFVREYRGKTHVVEVGEDGCFAWNAQRFKSLSHTARASMSPSYNSQHQSRSHSPCHSVPATHPEQKVLSPTSPFGYAECTYAFQ